MLTQLQLLTEIILHLDITFQCVLTVIQEVEWTKMVAVYLIPKWQKIRYSFAYMLIGPCCLVLSQRFFLILQMQSRQ